MPKVMSIINTFSRAMQKKEWKRKRRETREPWKRHRTSHHHHSLDLIRFPSSISTTDLNGLVKFFISTDEINLPHRTWSFFACAFSLLKSELLRREKGTFFRCAIVWVNNCFCIENYVNKIKENLLGKSIILGPVSLVSLRVLNFTFFSDTIYGSLSLRTQHRQSSVVYSLKIRSDDLRMFYASQRAH